MSSSLRVNTIVPSTGTNVAIGTANGTVTFIDSVNFVLGTGSSIFSPASNTLTFGTNDAERLRIDSAGNLGIGDASPTKPLTVGTTTPVILLDDQSSRTLEIRGPSTTHNATVLTTSTHDLLLGTNNAERFRITSAGRIGINQTSPGAMLQVDYDEGSSEVGLRLRAYNASGSKTWQLSEINGTAGVFTIRNATNSQNNLSIDGSSGYVGVNNTSPERRLEVVETASSLTYPVAVSNFTNASAGVGAAIDFRLTTGGNTRGELGLVYAGNSNSDGTDFVFKPNDGSTGNIERLRISGDGHVRINTGDLRVGDNTDSNAGSQTISVGSVSSGSGGIGIFANPTNGNSWVQFGDGTSSSDQYRGYMNYRHADDSLRFGTAGSERLRILSSGFVNIGNGYLTNSNSGLHVGRSSGGTAAGESVLAATLGNDSSMISALLTVKNAGNRGSQGHSSGSSLAKFEFNNGTAFEIDKHGRRTLPYQPAFKCKLSGATGANFTGVFVFGNVSYNIGSHYNSSNGRFTAPVDGRYLFSWYTNMERAGGNGAFYADWMINGSNQGNRMYTHHSGAWELIGGTVIFDLNANDYVQINAITSGNWDGGQYGSYSGYLLG